MTPLAFIDTETTGLSLDDEIWEFACIRREPDGGETTTHLFIEHSKRCRNLPESFILDHDKRFPASHTQTWHGDVVQRWSAADTIQKVTAGAHIVGAVPNFDTERMAIMLRSELEEEPQWHHHLIDVEAMALGYLNGKAYALNDPAERPDPPPWKSDELAKLCGVEPPGEGERHTALGDARWAMRWYDAMTGGVS